MPILQIKTMRTREIKQLAQGHRDRKLFGLMSKVELSSVPFQILSTHHSIPSHLTIANLDWAHRVPWNISVHVYDGNTRACVWYGEASTRPEAHRTL